MEPRELTKEHREKLLEMCKELFPEYDFEFLSNFSEWGIISVHKIGQHEIFENTHHWFEFCITKLSYKIFDNLKFPARNAGDDSVQYLCDMMDRQTWYIKEAYHPVDYLYKKFLKLENGK